MFGMGFSEILMIAIVAIIFLGPDKLPQFLVDIAKFFKSVKRAINDAKTNIEREVQLSELKEEALEYKERFKNITEEISETITADLDEDPLAEVEEIERARKSKKEVVSFKKRQIIDEDKDQVNV